jgi:hypothetical protein
MKIIPVTAIANGERMPKNNDAQAADTTSSKALVRDRRFIQ